MGYTSATMHCLLVILISLHCWMYQARSEDNVGCMFSPAVCDVTEQCFDDNVFGRCQTTFGTDVDLYRHALDTDNIQLLENELARLFAGGYRWSHEYTQCVIQNILYSSRHQISYDPGLCSRLMQFTLPEVPPEVLSELESPDPDELAFIKFNPNREDPQGDLYADEIFTPPIFSERAALKEEADKRSPINMPYNHAIFNHKSEKEKSTEGNTMTDKETLIQELYKAAHDTQKLLEGLEGSSADRYPDDNIPVVKTERSSDLEQAPFFTEGGTEWHPVSEEDDDLIEPFDKKRVKLLTAEEHGVGPIDNVRYTNRPHDDDVRQSNARHYNGPHDDDRLHDNELQEILRYDNERQDNARFGYGPHDNARQHDGRQNDVRYDNGPHNKARQGNGRQGVVRLDNVPHNNARQDNGRQGVVRLDNVPHNNARQDNGRQGVVRLDNVPHNNARQDNGRQGVVRLDNEPHNNARQDDGRQGVVRLDNPRQDNGRQGVVRLDKGRQSNVRYDKDLLQLQPELLPQQVDDDDDEPPTFGRSNDDDDEDDRNFRWNSKHRNRLQDDDLMRFAKDNRLGDHRIGSTAVKVEREPQEDYNLSDVIENDYLEDQLYAILPTMQKNLPTFTSDKRYDTKKPGPTYMIHEDEDGDSSQVDDMAMLGADNLIQRFSKNIWPDRNQLHTLFGAPVGSSKPLSPFLRQFEATDEISRIYVASDDEDPPPTKENQKEKENEEPKAKTFERLAADQPEVIEGVDLDEIKTHEDKIANAAKTGEGHMGRYDSVDATRANLAIKEKDLNDEKAQQLVKTFEKYLNLDRGSFSNVKVKGQEISFKVNPNSEGYNASVVAIKAEELSPQLFEKTGLTIEGAVIGDKVRSEVLRPDHDRRLVVLAFAACGAVSGLLLVAVAAYLVRRHSKAREKLHNIAQPDTEASQDYQDLCRQRMASKANEKPEHVVNSPKKIRSLSQEGQVSSSSHSSTSSWNEEPVTSNMDISTGHMILSYMEDHLKNKDRLDREWEALCAYEAELCASTAATQPHNIKKNRYTDILPYDHSRVVLNELSNISGSDYINASSITDHDPRNPAYIATQGPLPQTAADFWQMIWEQGSVVVVMLSRLMENGVAMCHRYWPEEGSEVYHIYEVHLVSEHIWCDDYLVRSFYLKNLKTSETRTVTQFHFMSWPDNGVPNSTKALLEFRRKVNKSYRGRSCPVVVHCSDGIGRTGTYCLIDMVLNRMAKGAKEIDIAATLEHVRDQRAGMVKTKAQFEFVLMAIAEEVHAILKALSQ